MDETGLALLVTVGLAVLIPCAAIAINALLSTGHASAVKAEAYESGIHRTVGTARQRFSVKYYLVTILFILFDIEVVFMFPWAINLRDNGGWIMLLEMVAFVAVLLVGYLYVVWKGALEWD